MKYKPGDKAWVDRFLASIPEEPDEQNCWNWQGYVDPKGYGELTRNPRTKMRRMEYAHRISYAHFVGPIPEGMTIDHLCRNRRCVNPDHLEAVSRKVNILRGQGACARNARKTRCIRGHPLSGDNLRSNCSGRRVCRECVNAAERRAYWARKLDIRPRREAETEAP